MKFYLIVAKGKRQGFPIPIEIDLFTIGSAMECQLRAVHERIGHQHCALVMRGRKVFIRDLSSGQPTVVNNEVLPASEEWPLHAGDRIEIGPLQFMIQYREKALSQRDLEEWALRCLDQVSERKVTAMDQLESLETYTDEAEGAAQVAAALLDRLPEFQLVNSVHERCVRRQFLRHLQENFFGAHTRMSIAQTAAAVGLLTTIQATSPQRGALSDQR